MEGEKEGEEEEEEQKEVGGERGEGGEWGNLLPGWSPFRSCLGWTNVKEETRDPKSANLVQILECLKVYNMLGVSQSLIDIIKL